MSKLSQKDAVYNAIRAYLSEQGRHFDDGDKLDLSPDDRKTITTMIVSAIQAGEVDLSAEAAEKHSSPKKIRNYTTGLLSNWLRKDTRLNGGSKHTTKNPGSRVGQDDDIVKKLKALRKMVSRRSDINKIDAEIQLRLKQICAEKTPNVSLNKEHIPAHLQHLVK